MAVTNILKRFSIIVDHDMWLDWNDSFMDNMTIHDAEMFSLARNSVSIGHDDGYIPVVTCSDKPSKKKFLGRTVFTAQTIRRGVGRHRVLYLFGKMPVLDLPLSQWRKLFRCVHKPIDVIKGIFK